MGTEAKTIPSKLVSGKVPLDAAAKTEFQSCTGSLQYLSGSTRPDLAAVTSLAQGSNPTYENLEMAYRLIRYARETSDSGIVINPVDIKKLLFVGYGDISWANAERLRTQTGKLVVVTTTDAFTGSSPGSIMDWRSTRTKRVVRSTLAGETIAADVAADHTYYVAAFFEEALYQRKATSKKLTLPCVICRDRHSLYDAVLKVQATLEECRTLIDLLSIKEVVGESGIHWVPTHEQHADGLTKMDRKLLFELTAYMLATYVVLREAS